MGHNIDFAEHWSFALAPNEYGWNQNKDIRIVMEGQT